MRSATLLSCLTAAAVIAPAGVAAAGEIARAINPPEIALTAPACITVGAEVVVTIELTDLGDFGGDGIAAGALDLLYDPAILDYVSDDVVSPFVNPVPTPPDEINGTISLNLVANPPVMSPQGMATITFAAVSGDVCDLDGLVQFAVTTTLTPGGGGPITPVMSDLPLIGDILDPVVTPFTLQDAVVNEDCRVSRSFEVFIDDNCNLIDAGCTFEILQGSAFVVGALL